MKYRVLVLKTLFLIANASFSLLGAQSFQALSGEELVQFEGVMQQYCYVSTDLFLRINKHKAHPFLSTSNQAKLESVEQKYQSEVGAIRKNFFNPSTSQQALFQGADHIFQICDAWKIRRCGVLSYSTAITSDSSPTVVISHMKSAVAALETYYKSLHPRGALLKRIENALFYNFFTTKIAPKLILVGGIAASLQWAGRNLDRYQNALDERKEENILYSYGKGHPHEEQRNYSYGDSSYRSYKTYCNPNPGMCSLGKDGKLCYDVEGINKNIPAIAFQLLKASKVFAPIVLARFIAEWAEEAQMPTYLHRIKLAQKALEEKKIEQEMQTLKVNHEYSIGFSDIKGHDKLIEREFALIVDYLKHPFKYETSSGRLSFLLYGPPGTGKTLLARSIAKESGAPFLEISADDMLTENSKDKILATLKLAEKVALARPQKSAIIYIDEIDFVVGNRKNGPIDPQRAKALSNLLTIFDGIEKQNPNVHIVIILTTNHHSNLDAALLRPGRIDQAIYIGCPDNDERAAFITALIPEKNIQLVSFLTEKTEGKSGAYLVSVVEKARMIASFKKHTLPLVSDYQEALDKLSFDQANVV